MIYVLQEHFTGKVVNAFSRKWHVEHYIEKHGLNPLQHDIVVCNWASGENKTLLSTDVIKEQNE